MTFLPQIEGLRALAVLAVVAFHFAPYRVTGGFLGVDIFYVISGYLITRIILRSSAEGRFSLFDFYRRRLLRLGPAIALVVGVSVVFGWFVLFNDEYAQLGRSTLASSLFIQNLNLLREGGYFDEHAELKVFLHLWSLSVEMQFYLFWGFVIFLLRRRQNWLLSAAIMFTIVSVGSLALAGPVSREALFYLPNFRLWEFTAGSIVYIVSAQWTKAAFKWAGALQLAATAALIGMVLLGDEQRITASILITVTITAMLLFSLSIGPAVTLLTNPAAVFIGRISYPLYMWHWPLLVYARIIESDTPSREMRLGLIVASVVLAAATFFLLERPLSRVNNKRALAWGLVGAFAVLGLGGAVTMARDGFPGRATLQDYAGTPSIKSEAPRFVACGQDVMRAFSELSDCVTTGPSRATNLLIGDSHAKHLIGGLSIVDRTSTWMLLSQNSCPPVIGVQFFIGGAQICPKFTEELMTFVAERAFKTVVIAFAGTYLQTTSYNADQKLAKNGPETFTFKKDGQVVPNADAFGLGLRTFVTRLKAAEVSVWVIADNFELPFFPKSCIKRPLKWNYNVNCAVPLAEARQRQRPMFDLLDKLKDDHLAGVIDANDSFCNETSCRARLDGQVVYRDSHHVNDAGAIVLARQIVRAIK